MHLTKEEQILLQHFNDMIQLSYQRSIPVYSQFCSLSELELAYQALEENNMFFAAAGIFFRISGNSAQ